MCGIRLTLYFGCLVLLVKYDTAGIKDVKRGTLS
jgi:hypothetical protein